MMQLTYSRIFNQSLLVRLGLVVFLAVLDLITKQLFGGHLNYGISFGMFQGVGNLVWFVVQILLSCVLFLCILKCKLGRLIAIGMLCIVAGGFGNAISRVIWDGVPDWIVLAGFVGGFCSGRIANLIPAFNLADVYINLGVVLSVVGFVREKFNKS